MNIIGMKKSSQVDSMMKVTASNSSQNLSAVARELRMGDIKRKGGQVFTNENGYIIKGMSALPTVAFVNLLKKENKGVVEVNYKSDLDGNDQISETEEPLWSVDKQDGNFNIKRNS